MLISLYCPELKTQKHPNGRINFHPGLNVVLGEENGANSIGKSTALLMIDFAYGGHAYSQSDAVRELGDHEVFFTFRFGNKEYTFSRNTEQPGTIFCQSNSEEYKTLELKKYTEWLCQKYKMDYPGVSFRNTLSRFFRIYNKSKIDETQPLKIRDAERNLSAINTLLYLFNHYDEISTYQERLNLVKDMYTSFTKAKTFRFIPYSISKKGEYDAAQEKLAKLREKKESLSASTPSVINEEDVEKANQANELKRELRDIRKKLERKKTDIHIVNLNLEFGSEPTEADLNALASFFPNVNLEKITEIEKFHRKIQAILKDEMLRKKEYLEFELISLQKEAEGIQRRFNELKPSPAFSDEFLAAYTQLDRQIVALQKECNYYTNLEQLRIEKKQAQDSLETHTTLLLHETEKVINAEMETISDFISNGKDNAPILRLIKSNSYTFETPQDSGTGTNYKGMLIYDLSILKLTRLPALAHDSLLFSNISDESLKQLILMYTSVKDKQIFIAYDRQDNLGSDISALLNEFAVIKLGPGKDTLFGRQWGKRNQDH